MHEAMYSLLQRTSYVEEDTSKKYANALFTNVHWNTSATVTLSSESASPIFWVPDKYHEHKGKKFTVQDNIHLYVSLQLFLVRI